MQILVRDLDEAVVLGLKKRAARNRRSLEAEVRSILDEAATADAQGEERARNLEEFRIWAAELRAKNAHVPQSDSVDLISEDRDR